jgi:membrane associated rhomboid family serine protease
VSATKAIVFLTGLVFVAMVATGFRSLLLIPPDVLVTFGASSGVETIARAELWRLVTSMFVHGNLCTAHGGCLRFTWHRASVARSAPFSRIR